MHGLTDAQFLSKVSSFLGVFYVALAAMNGVAALYLWRTSQMKTWFNVPVGGGKSVPFTNAFGWLLLAFLFIGMAPLAASSNGNWMPSMPIAWREAINPSPG